MCNYNKNSFMLRPGPATKDSGIMVEFALPMTIVQCTLHVEFASVSCGDEWLAQSPNLATYSSGSAELPVS